MTDRAATLDELVAADPDTTPGTLRRGNVALSIGEAVRIAVWRNRVTCAVDADADVHTVCGAVLDALALLHDGTLPAGDRSGVNVLVGRALRWGESETDEALATIRHTAGGVVCVWYRDGDSWAQDLIPPPIWPVDNPTVRKWLNDYLTPRRRARPTGLPLAVVEAVDDPSIHLYPPKSGNRFAVRLDGLQIGTLGATTGTLTVGKPRRDGSSGPQRREFIDVFGSDKVTVALAPGGEQLSVNEAAAKIRELLLRWRPGDIAGAPVTHRRHGPEPIIDEHALEARLLAGLLRIGDDSDTQLIAGDAVVARGSQFPTLWAASAPAPRRYLDALVCDGRKPVAAELKVATGGQGRYYRRALVQAILYRHFIANADALDDWFGAFELDRSAVRAVVGIPEPARNTATFERQVESLTAVAAHFDVDITLIDDRRVPDRNTRAPQPTELEPFIWQLGAALSERWPRALGRVIEVTDVYPLLSFRGLDDRSLDWPAPRPRIEINRNGSLRVRSPHRGERWVWRSVWAELAAGLDAGIAADWIGAIAGLGPRMRPKDTPPKFTFPQLAAMVHEHMSSTDWRWRSAWLDLGDRVAPWLARYDKQIARYGRIHGPREVPTIARIWGVVRDDDAIAIVDQENLKCWAWNGATVAGPYTGTAAIDALLYAATTDQ